MNILKIIGIVAGIHVVAFFLMFVNPGCRSTSGAPSRADTLPAPVVAPPAQTTPAAPTVPAAAAVDAGSATAPQVSVSIPTSGPRYAPTRPGTSASEALETAPVSDVIPASTYTVVRGDSLSRIAKRNHTTKDELMKANHLSASSVLSVGQKLIVPGKSPAAGNGGSAPVAEEPAHRSSPPAAEVHAPASASPAGSASVKAPEGATTHEVKAGETIGAIARKYHVKTQDLLVANNITDPRKVRAGQILVIPGGASSKGAAAPAATSPSVKPSPALPAGAAPSTAISDSSSAAPSQAEAQDADSSGKPQGDVPVIKVDDGSEPKTP